MSTRRSGAGSTVLALLAAVAGLLTFTPTAAAADVRTPIASALHGKCLDLGKGHAEDSAWIIQWPCHGRDNQQWLLTPDPSGAGVVKIRNAASNKCVDVMDKSTGSGALLHYWGCQEAPAKKDVSTGSQVWRMVAKGTGNGQSYFNLQNVRSGKCIDVPAGTKSDGARLIQFDCTGATNQLWRIPTPAAQQLVSARQQAAPAPPAPR